MAMPSRDYNALVVRDTGQGRFTQTVERCSTDDLPAGDLLIRVHFSSLNYKDALSATGNRGVTRAYPHTTGVDAAGVVETSGVEPFTSGQSVIVTGRDLGMNTAGGHSEYIRVPAEWAVPLPAAITLEQSMVIGTAGMTAALSVMRLQSVGVQADQGDILVTGATGGVGGLAVAILSRIGYRVVAATGKPDAAALLRELGAAQVISRNDIDATPDRPLASRRWAGVIDTVGGRMLDAAIRSTQPHGAVTCCGMIGSAELRTSIFPFILRGVALLGVDAAETPMPQRRAVWEKLAGDWKPALPECMITHCTLEDLPAMMRRMLDGKSLGRVVVRLHA